MDKVGILLGRLNNQSPRSTLGAGTSKGMNGLMASKEGMSAFGQNVLLD
jgi:hypothetical protein